MGEICWLDGDHPVFGQTFVLCVPAKIDGKGGCKNRVAWLEAGHLPANRFNFPGQFHPQDRAFGSANPQVKARYDLLPTTDGQVETTHGGIANDDSGGMNFDQHFQVTGCGFLHFLQVQHFRRPILDVNDGFHLSFRFSLSCRSGGNLGWFQQHLIACISSPEKRIRSEEDAASTE